MTATSSNYFELDGLTDAPCLSAAIDTNNLEGLAMTTRPSVKIDWENAGATFELGDRLEAEDAVFKLDVLDDICNDVYAAREEVFDEEYPGLQARMQRAKNARRRMLMDSLIGQTIRVAKSLKNGHVGIQLMDGRVLYLGALKEDIDVRTATSLETVEAFINTIDSDYFEAEPALDEPPISLGEIRICQMFNKSSG